MDLPTVEQCRAFFDALNEERASLGLELLAPGELDYDDAQPGSSSNCLSARNCYVAAGVANWVGCLSWMDAQEDVFCPIPATILVVTDYFDDYPYGSSEHETLRARLVEVGAVS